MGSSKDPPVGLPDTDDPYVLLDVRPGASADQIRRAYLRRVKVYKPDRYPAEFRRVREAYDRLREQEAWFDAWRQASEVVRQAQEAQRRQGEGEGAEPGGAGNADTDPAPKTGEEADAALTPKAGGEAGPELASKAASNADTDPAPRPGSGVDTDPALDDGADGPPLEFVDTDVMEPSDEALEAEERAQAEEDEDDVSLEQIMAEIDDELQANRRPPPIASGWIEVGEPRPEPETPPRVVLGLYMDDETLDLPHVDPRRRTIEAVPPAGAPAPEATPDGIPERLEALTEAVHEDLQAERYTEAAARLLDRETLTLATRPGFSTLLLEACCALVWAAPERFDELVARYGDLIAGQDTEYRDGALLHRRTLTDELSAWRQAVAGWPELDRFVMLGSSLRPPAEAELGLVLGQRAAEDSAGFLEVICQATAQAPGIAALYVGMAERWAARFGELPAGAPARTRPTVQQAAEALAERAQRDRWVRWEQLRPVLVVLVMGAILVRSSSRVIELAVIGLVLGLWAWRAWAASPEERIYVKVLRPSAASWLWATQASVDELAVAFEGTLPKRGSWAAVLHPGDLTEYPQYLGNDLALLAFAVTAPMIPRLGGRRG